MRAAKLRNASPELQIVDFGVPVSSSPASAALIFALPTNRQPGFPFRQQLARCATNEGCPIAAQCQRPLDNRPAMFLNDQNLFFQSTKTRY